MRCYFQGMKSEEQVPISVNISLEARKILEKRAQKIVHDEGDQLPLGRVITAMVLWFEEREWWEEIQQEIRADFAREAQERRKRDRERKRTNL